MQRLRPAPNASPVLATTSITPGCRPGASTGFPASTGTQKFLEARAAATKTACAGARRRRRRRRWCRPPSPPVSPRPRRRHQPRRRRRHRRRHRPRRCRRHPRPPRRRRRRGRRLPCPPATPRRRRRRRRRCRRRPRRFRRHRQPRRRLRRRRPRRRRRRRRSHRPRRPRRSATRCRTGAPTERMSIHRRQSARPCASFSSIAAAPSARRIYDGIIRADLLRMGLPCPSARMRPSASSARVARASTGARTTARIVPAA